MSPNLKHNKILIIIIALILAVIVILSYYIAMDSDYIVDDIDLEDNYGSILLKYETMGFGVPNILKIYSDGYVTINVQFINGSRERYVTSISNSTISEIDSELIDRGIFSLKERYQSDSNVASERSAEITYKSVSKNEVMYTYDTTIFEDRPEKLQNILEYLSSLRNELMNSAYKISYYDNLFDVSDTALLTISLEKSEFKMGENINVNITVTNIGDEIFSFENFVIGGNTFFNITNSTGQRLPDLSFQYYADVRGLEPGQSYSQTIAIIGYYTIPRPDDYTIKAEIYCLGISDNELSFTVIE